MTNDKHVAAQLTVVVTNPSVLRSVFGFFSFLLIIVGFITSQTFKSLQHQQNYTHKYILVPYI